MNHDERDQHQAERAPSREAMTERWWDVHSNIAGVVDYMARVREDTGRTIAEFVAKPWNWPELWVEYQAAINVGDIDVVHARRDGECVVSLNGQGHFPCGQH